MTHAVGTAAPILAKSDSGTDMDLKEVRKVNLGPLLADMRRKYMHATARGNDPDWLKGEPITAQILERWIPDVEQSAEALRVALAEVDRLEKEVSLLGQMIR